MAISATLVKGPGLLPGVGHLCIFDVSLDEATDSFAAGGEALDLTDYFDYVYSAKVTSVDDNADNAYLFGVVIPTRDTALSASNLLISAYQSPAKTGDAESEEPFGEADTVDFNSVTQLGLEVIGHIAVSG